MKYLYTDAGPTLLCADAVGVDLAAEQLGPGVVVAVHVARGARVPLHAVSRGPAAACHVLSQVTCHVSHHLHSAVQEICLARMLKVLAVVRPELL